MTEFNTVCQSKHHDATTSAICAICANSTAPGVLLLVNARERTRSRMTAVRANLRNPLGRQGCPARSSVAVIARELKL